MPLHTSVPCLTRAPLSPAGDTYADGGCSAASLANVVRMLVSALESDISNFHLFKFNIYLLRSYCLRVLLCSALLSLIDAANLTHQAFVVAGSAKDGIFKVAFS